MQLLTGKVAAITGATGSIARAIAQRFAREGATVGVIDPDAAAGGALAAELARSGAKSRAFTADVGLSGEVEKAIEAVVAAFGRLDVLVHNAWTPTPFVPLLDKPEREFRASLETGLFGALRAMRAAVPHLRKADGGRIILVGAPYGHTTYANVADAVCTDYALQGLTRAAGVEWGKYRIVTNLLLPALADVPEFQAYRAQQAAAVKSLLPMQPLRRLGDPVEDIGGAAVMLACDEGCFITGHTIHADGGQHMNPATFRPAAPSA